MRRDGAGTWNEVFYVAFEEAGPVAYGTVFRMGHETPEQAVLQRVRKPGNGGLTAVYLMPTLAAAAQAYAAAKGR